MNTHTDEVDVYCPCCSETSKSPVFALIGPGGAYEWQCPQCEEQFVVRVEFIPQEPS